jgi:hypothetical protein
MKIGGVDVLDAFARGFGIGFIPALIASLVGYVIKTGWVEAPLDWSLWPMFRDMVVKSFAISIFVSVVLGLFVFLGRLGYGGSTSRTGVSVSPKPTPVTDVRKDAEEHRRAS